MSDEEVRAVLVKAAWSKSEIDAALALLRTGGQGSIAPGSSANAFNPDMEFSSKQLSSLLGVDVVVDPGRLAYHYPSGGGPTPVLRGVLIRVLSGFAVITLSLGLALAAGISFLYYLEIGPFRT